MKSLSVLLSAHVEPTSAFKLLCRLISVTAGICDSLGKQAYSGRHRRRSKTLSSSATHAFNNAAGFLLARDKRQSGATWELCKSERVGGSRGVYSVCVCVRVCV